MNKIIREGYVIRFKKKKEAPILPTRDGVLLSFVIEKKLKNDYLYFNPNRPGTEVFGSYPDIINSYVDGLKTHGIFTRNIM